MKKLLCLVALLLLGTFAFGQCSTPTLDTNGVMIPDYFNCANYANSPLPQVDGTGQVIPGTGIRKFVDGLPGLGPSGANNLGQYIPVAIPDTTTYPGADYYEIAVVQYQEKMHTDLPPTTLRGYVQISTSVVPGAQLPLSNANLDGTTVPIAGFTGVDRPHYLGPTIIAMKNRPVRILFRNLLPTGVAGNLFIPVDTTVMGAGMGPGMGGMADPPPDAMCAMEPKAAECYKENRATLHLHGGLTPWISDGTPHQWTTPANEATPYPKGVSVSNVPDMPDPGPGAITFFYTNQQSARLMFYHDHAWGITRLNVYAGEAAGYVLTDAMEQALIGTGGALDGLGVGIPLVIQDKTFVPEGTGSFTNLGITYPSQLTAQDPTWDLSRWGGAGQLWMPHVYVPAQNPGDVSGSNAFGRWAYGPWFWPPQNYEFGPRDNPYFDLNCDPDVVGWCQPPQIPGVPYISMGMEAFNDTPLVNGTVYPTVTLEPKPYRLRILNAANDRFFNLQLYVADSTGTEVALKAAEVTAALDDPNVFPTPDTTLSPAGPSWIQIGTEGGFLPAPVVVPNQVITWVTDPTVFNAGNVKDHALLLGPAERADVIVDFSAYGGKTLILYNDSPAAFPARDPRYDYYTGSADLTDTGGAPGTLPGYGPNTRTIMQIKVSGGTGPGFNLATLQAAFAHHLDANNKPAGVFEASQDPIIVGQGAYNPAYGTAFRNTAPRDGFARITDFSMTFDTLSGTVLSNFQFQNKAIHDEMNAAFDPVYGRMSGNLGLEAPLKPAGQNIILYPYVNPASEILNGVELPMGSLDVTPIASLDDGSQIWKITHNGVDTHPIHFHLFNVQLLNRVGWDGVIRKPEASELGWKDTIRVSPLEDTIVALRPIVPKQPFGVPDSLRPLNPMMPLGSTTGFNNVGPDGNPLNTPIVNEIVNFGWEYVWHCHILSHEEMDMMRPMSLNVSRLLPAAPIVSYAFGNGIDLTWIDGTPADYANPLTWGDPGNEIGFRVERADVVNNNVGAYSVLGFALANQTAFNDSSANGTSTYSYRVVAFNAAGDSVSTAITVTPAAPIAGLSPSVLAFGTQLVNTTSAPLSATLSNTGTGPLTINSITLTGADFGNFAIVASASSCGASLAAGANCTIDVTFTPDAARAFTGGVSVSSNDAANPTLSLSLTGTGVTTPLTITANDATRAFGTANPTFTATYAGFVGSDTPASLTGTLACTTTAQQNSPVGTYPITCSGQTSSKYAITYVPGTLTITATGPVLTLAPAALQFVSTPNVASPAQAVTVSNTGSAPLIITRIALGGVNAARFSQTNNCPIGGAGLPSGQNCTVNVQFTPNTNPVTRTAALNVTVAGPATSGSVALTGNTIRPTVTVAPSALAFGNQPINTTSAPQTITVSNSGTLPVIITSITLGGANPARFAQTNTCPIGGAGLAPGTNCTISVTFRPNRRVARSATITIRDNAAGSPQRVTLTGTGI